MSYSFIGVKTIAQDFTLDLIPRRALPNEIILGDSYMLMIQTIKSNYEWIDIVFFKPCEMLGHVGGLQSIKPINIGKQVAMTLYLSAHHKNNQIIKFDFGRSGKNVS